MAKRSCWKIFLIFLFFSFTVDKRAEANVGLPMIFITLPSMLAALIPIIALESFILRQKLSLSWRTSLKTISIANIVSTLFGIPLVWIILVIFEISFSYLLFYLPPMRNFYGNLDSNFAIIFNLILQSPWLVPIESELYWMIPVAFLVLLFPFFLFLGLLSIKLPKESC